MRQEWRTVLLKDVLQPKGYIRGPFGSALKRGDMLDTGIPVYEQQHAIYGSRQFRFHISENKYMEMKRFSIQPDDIIISCSGTVGKVSIITKDDPIGIISQALLLLRVNADVIDPLFLCYFFRSYEGYNAIVSRSSGSVQVNISKREVIEQIPLRLPDIQTQRRIVSILSSLDQKIVCNAKINDNLYDLLQSVYQLQFGVTSGNAAEGTLSDICSYTKDRIAVSELSLGNYYSTENMLPGKAGFTEATSLPTTPQTTRCNAGDVLVSNIRPYFKKIVLCHSEGGCSTDVLCFAPKAPAYSAYLFCTLYADRFFDFMVAGSKGTKMPRGDKQQIMTYPVYIPTESELTAFADFATPILSQIHGNNEENARLEHLRDTLLPKLMSGEIDVSAIDI